METIEQDLYEAPAANVIVVKAEGAILTVSGDAPQYEGPEEENGNDMIYFDNKDMLFKLREGAKWNFVSELYVGEAI